MSSPGELRSQLNCGRYLRVILSASGMSPIVPLSQRLWTAVWLNVHQCVLVNSPKYWGASCNASSSCKYCLSVANTTTSTLVGKAGNSHLQNTDSLCTAPIV